MMLIVSLGVIGLLLIYLGVTSIKLARRSKQNQQLKIWIERRY